MAFSVRVFGYSGITQMPMDKPKQFSSDSVYQLTQPYLWAQTISVSAVAASSVANTDSRTMLLRIEVPDGQTVRYEINPPNREGGAVVAGSGSPSMSGKDQYYFRQGWTISLVDASSLP